LRRCFFSFKVALPRKAYFSGVLFRSLYSFAASLQGSRGYARYAPLPLLAHSITSLPRGTPSNTGHDGRRKTLNEGAFYMFTFGKQFYPTPQIVIDEMVKFVDFAKIQTVLEPSAGKGDIVDRLITGKERRLWGRDDKIDIDCCELDENLRHLLKGKKYKVVHDDFLTYQTVKKYDLIIMNPPFAEGERHLLKALDFQSRGGRVICLLNAETIKNPYTLLRKNLVKQLEKLNATVKYIQNAFVNAERSSNVEIALICADVPANGESILLDSLKKATIPEAKDIEGKKLVASDYIQGLLQSYDHLARLGASFIGEYREIKEFLPGDCKDLLKLKICDEVSYYDKDFMRDALNTYVRRLRRVFWKKLFENKEWLDRLTSNLINVLHEKINDLMDYEFSEYNIMRLWLEVMSNMSDFMEKTIMTLFDTCSHDFHYMEYSDNIHYYNGWKTNKCWKINSKIILPMYAFSHWDKEYRFDVDWRCREKLTDIEKVFDVLNSKPRDFPCIANLLEWAKRNKQTKNIKTKYFTITFYKKGTAHITFTDMELLKKFNIFAGQRKGWLPPTYGKKHYAEMSPEEQHVIESFEGAINYEDVMSNKEFYLIENKKSLLALEQAG
jgi:hypothetical protein